MTWTKTLRHKPGSTHIQISWSGPTIYNVALSGSDGVTRVSHGNSSRPEMRSGSKYIEGIYKWGPGVESPTCWVSWSDAPDGDGAHSQEFSLS